MKILKLIEKLFKFNGILLTSDTPAAWRKATFKHIFNLTCFGFFLFTTKTIIKYHNDIVRAASAISLFIAGCMAIGKYIFLRINRENIRDFIESFQKLVDQSKHSSWHFQAAAKESRNSILIKKNLVFICFPLKHRLTQRDITSKLNWKDDATLKSH